MQKDVCNVRCSPNSKSYLLTGGEIIQGEMSEAGDGGRRQSWWRKTSPGDLTSLCAPVVETVHGAMFAAPVVGMPACVSTLTSRIHSETACCAAACTAYGRNYYGQPGTIG